MLHCECGWAFSYAEDGIHCPFCGRVGVAGPDAPEEAKQKIAQAKSE